MKRISLIRTSSDRKSEPSRRDERCARVGITGASVRYEGRLFEVIEGTDHPVAAEVALSALGGYRSDDGAATVAEP